MSNRSYVLRAIGIALFMTLFVGCGGGTATPISAPEPSISRPISDPSAVQIAPEGTGDYPDLETAAKEVDPGTTIVLEPGTYNLEKPLDIGKSLRLIGAGMDKTEIVSEAADYVLQFSGDGLFSVEGIAFRHEGDDSADVVVVQGGEVAFSRCSFTGATAKEVGERRAGLRLDGSTTGVVEECSATNNHIGILVDNQAQPTLENNTVVENEADGIAYYGKASGLARYNDCSRNGIGIGVDDQAQPTLEGNRCNDNNSDGIGFFGSSSGVARENECSGNGLEGILVDHQAQPTLEGNTCSGNFFHGIKVDGDAQPTLQGNITAENQIGISYFGESGGLARLNQCSGNGVGIQVTANAMPTLEENICRNNEQTGIQYWGRVGGVAKLNECSQNGISGIGVLGLAHPALIGNICLENGMFGIEVLGEAEPSIDGNIFRNNVEAGMIYAETASGQARENECSGNGLWGIFVVGNATPVLESNTCEDNGQAGIAFFEEGGGEVRMNECSGNTVGIYVDETAYPDLSDNNCHDNSEADIRDERP